MQELTNGLSKSISQMTGTLKESGESFMKQLTRKMLHVKLNSYQGEVGGNGMEIIDIYFSSCVGFPRNRSESIKRFHIFLEKTCYDLITVSHFSYISVQSNLNTVNFIPFDCHYSI